MLKLQFSLSELKNFKIFDARFFDGNSIYALFLFENRLLLRFEDSDGSIFEYELLLLPPLFEPDVIKDEFN